LYPLHVSAPMGHPQVQYTTSQSLEAIMPTADLLFLLGYTIIIHIRFMCGESAIDGFLVGMRCIYIVDTNCITFLFLHYYIFSYS
jgi:hypothetical protein